MSLSLLIPKPMIIKTKKLFNNCINLFTIILKDFKMIQGKFLKEHKVKNSP